MKYLKTKTMVRTSYLIVVVEACSDRHVNRAVEEEINHHLLARLAEEGQQLWPGGFSKSLDVGIRVQTEYSGNRRPARV